MNLTHCQCSCSRLSELGRWLLMLAGSVTIIGISTPTRDDAADRAVEKERPFAQTACEARGSPIGSLAFSPDGASLASAAASGEVWLGDLMGGRWDLIGRAPSGSAHSVAFSPDGRALAVAGFGPIVRLLDPESGEELEPLALDRGNNAMHVAFSRDGKYLASGGFGGELTLWRWADRRRLAALKIRRGGTISLAFSPDGSTLAAGDSAGLVGLWDVNSREERTIFQAHGPGEGVTAVAFSPDGTQLVTASYVERTVRLWTPDGELRATLPRVDHGAGAGLARWGPASHCPRRRFAGVGPGRGPRAPVGRASGVRRQSPSPAMVGSSRPEAWTGACASGISTKPCLGRGDRRLSN